MEFWLLSGAMAAGSAFLLHLGVRFFWRLRTITDAPTARIQSASQGYLELGGTARPHQGQTAGPLTGTPCLWYRYSIEERKRSGKSEHWVRIEGGDCPTPFALDDGTGRCIVEPARAHLKLRRRTRWQGPQRSPRNRERGWLFSSDRYRFTEERIEEGDPIYLLGYFETPRRGPEERDRLRRALLKVWKQDPARIARFDRDGDGSLSPEEWELARQEAATLAESAELEQASKPVTPRVRDTGDARQPYVISTYTEEDLASGLRWQTLGATAGALALGVAATFMFLARLGLGR
jgi:hypothetical protein